MREQLEHWEVRIEREREREEREREPKVNNKRLKMFAQFWTHSEILTESFRISGIILSQNCLAIFVSLFICFTFIKIYETDDTYHPNNGRYG